MKNKQPIISVIIPIYNVDKYLKKCIESIINQTYVNLEIFLVDDGSTDRCSQICDEYEKKDDRIIAIHKTNGGQGSARNVALDRITGDNILFVDADDYLDLGAIDLLVKTAEITKADIICFGYILSNGIRDVSHFCEEFSFDTDIEAIKNFICNHNITPMMWTKFFKSELFENLRFPTELRKSEDRYIMPELLSRSQKTIGIKDCLYHQNARMGSLERSPFSKKDLDAILCEKHIADYIIENYPRLKNDVLAFDINAMASCAVKILVTHRFLQNRLLFHSLINQIRETYICLSKEYGYSIEFNDKVKYVVKHQTITIIPHFFLIGCFRKIKNICKKMIIIIKKALP
ncbi:MAG: glycosyltransferase [Lachnospiraceae bacterium]|nr:glycosyltransferase [Lachnospiraceae bacterium]